MYVGEMVRNMSFFNRNAPDADFVGYYTASRISLGNLKVDTGYPVVFLNDSHLLMAKIYLFKFHKVTQL